MPWPPTADTDLSIPLEWQLGAGMPGGLTPAVAAGVEGTSGLDPATGVLAPGVLGMQDSPLDVVDQMARIEAERRKALQAEDDEPEELSGATGKRAAIIKWAKQQLGKNYVWGGESDAEGGFDCSGLLWAAFKANGIDIPRVSMAQADRGTRVAISQLKPGDFVAWENVAWQKGADHIALYLGNGMILEAPGTGKKIRIRKLSESELNSPNAWGVKLDY